MKAHICDFCMKLGVLNLGIYTAKLGDSAGGRITLALCRQHQNATAIQPGRRADQSESGYAAGIALDAHNNLLRLFEESRRDSLDAPPARRA